MLLPPAQVETQPPGEGEHMGSRAVGRQRTVMVMVRALWEAQASLWGREGSFEMVEDLALHRLLDLAPSEHEL